MPPGASSSVRRRSVKVPKPGASWTETERRRLRRKRREFADLSWPKFHEKGFFPGRSPAAVYQEWLRLRSRKVKQETNTTMNNTQTKKRPFGAETGGSAKAGPNKQARLESDGQENDHSRDTQPPAKTTSAPPCKVYPAPKRPDSRPLVQYLSKEKDAPSPSIVTTPSLDPRKSQAPMNPSQIHSAPFISTSTLPITPSPIKEFYIPKSTSNTGNRTTHQDPTYATHTLGSKLSRQPSPVTATSTPPSPRVNTSASQAGSITNTLPTNQSAERVAEARNSSGPNPSPFPATTTPVLSSRPDISIQQKPRPLTAPPNFHPHPLTTYETLTETECYENSLQIIRRLKQLRAEETQAAATSKDALSALKQQISESEIQLAIGRGRADAQYADIEYLRDQIRVLGSSGEEELRSLKNRVDSMVVANDQTAEKAKILEERLESANRITVTQNEKLKSFDIRGKEEAETQRQEVDELKRQMGDMITLTGNMAKCMEESDAAREEEREKVKRLEEILGQLERIFKR